MGILDNALMINKRTSSMTFLEKLFGKNSPQKTAEVIETERIAKLTPKELATEKKEPWVAVLDTHINKDNIRNGFFELDWNEQFIIQLRMYGYKGETDEAIIDVWFTELCRNVGSESGLEMSKRGSGFINVNNLGDGRTEIS